MFMKRIIIAASMMGLMLPSLSTAAPNLTFGGEAGMGITSTTDKMDHKTTKFQSDVDFTFGASGVTDAGLTFGADVTIGNDPLEYTVHIGSDAIGTVTMGDVDPADNQSLASFGYGVDDVGLANVGGQTAAQVRYDASFGVVNLAVSVGKSEGMPAVAGSPAVIAMDSMYRSRIAADFTPIVDGMASEEDTNAVFNIYQPTSMNIPDSTSSFDNKVFKYMEEDHYMANGKLMKVNGCADFSTEYEAAKSSGEGECIVDTVLLGDEEVGNIVGSPIHQGSEFVPATMAKAAVKGSPASSGSTEYAAHFSADISDINVGLGFNSNKTISYGGSYTFNDQVTVSLLGSKNKTSKDQPVGMKGLGLGLSFQVSPELTVGGSYETMNVSSAPVEGLTMDTVDKKTVYSMMPCAEDSETCSQATASGKLKGYNIGVEYDLGGGAIASLGYTVAPSYKASYTKNKAGEYTGTTLTSMNTKTFGAGLNFSF